MEVIGQERYETFYLRQRGKRVRRIMYAYRMEYDDKVIVATRAGNPMRIVLPAHFLLKISVATGGDSSYHLRDWYERIIYDGLQCFCEPYKGS